MLNHHRYGTENRLSLTVSRLFELFEKKSHRAMRKRESRDVSHHPWCFFVPVLNLTVAPRYGRQSLLRSVKTTGG